MLLSIGLSSIAEEAPAEKNDDRALPTAKVTTAFIDMRAGPGRGYAIFYIAERGETLIIHSQRTDWLKVENKKGITGWAHVDDMATTLNYQDEPLNVSPPTLENFSNRRWETGFMAGDFGGNDTISIYGSYHFTQNLSTEISYTETYGDIADGQGVTLSLVHQPFPKWRYSPFIGLGAGTYETRPKSNLVASETRSDSSANVTAGLRIYLSRRMILRLQYTNYLILTNLDNDEEVDEWKIGLSTFY